jgi:hypothetical protein
MRACRYLEKVMKFINRNAYIIVAIKGYTYCGSAIRATKLIVNNVLRLAAVNVIGDALIFLGKVRTCHWQLLHLVEQSRRRRTH